MQANQTVRDTAKAHGVRLWQVAEVYGCNDGNFSRKLRHELPEDEQAKIIGIIHQLAKEAQS